MVPMRLSTETTSRRRNTTQQLDSVGVRKTKTTRFGEYEWYLDTRPLQRDSTECVTNSSCDMAGESTKTAAQTFTKTQTQMTRGVTHRAPSANQRINYTPRRVG